MTLLRWITALTVLAVTVAIGITVAGGVKPAYEAEGSMVLLGPTEKLVDVETNETEPLNPYAELTPKLETMATVIAHAITEGRTAHEFAERGHRYTLEVDGPIILVEATNTQPQASIATVLTVFAAIERELRVRQERLGSPENLQITGEVLAAPGPATQTTIDRDRALAATIALGLMAAFGASALVDRLNAARTRRAETRMPPRPAPAPAAARPPAPARSPAPAPAQPPPARSPAPAKPQPQPQPPAPAKQPQQQPSPAKQPTARETFWVPGRRSAR